MFHPVPRVDRWEPLLAGAALIAIATAIIVMAWMG